MSPKIQILISSDEGMMIVRALTTDAEQCERLAARAGESLQRVYYHEAFRLRELAQRVMAMLDA